MKNVDLNFSTGIQPLDHMIKGLKAGDNVVLRLDSIKDFIPFVHHFTRRAYAERKEIIYFRFALHERLVPEDVEYHIYHLEPEKGFENFISQIISTIEKFGIGTCYVFDSLSNLAVDWYSDVMVGNFFMLTCPYLYKFDTIAYFALIRNRHEQNTITNIQKTAQVVLEIYENEEEIYIQPVKVEKRYSPTLYMLHKWDRKEDSESIIYPVKESATIAKILARKLQPWLDFRGKKQDLWHITFKQAQETLEGILLGEISPVQANIFKNRLLKMAIVRDDLLFILAVNYFELEDLLAIGKRLIGTGLIGGKSVGMLIAQAILKKDDSRWDDILEIQDSFFIGSEVYYSFLVENDCWWERRKLCAGDTFLNNLDETNQKIMAGVFPPHIMEQFENMLDYYGQAPIIVRSSSLQEDAYGNSFSGKYESVFLANQGPPEERMEKFLQAVKIVYASTVGEDALTYRKMRGLLEKDEQMALLVQRVSGSIYGDLFYPQAAGVGFSFNPYVWDRRIDPKAGFIRLVFGLGTRAVDRTDDDYTRLVAVNCPTLRLEKNFSDILPVSQKKVDVLDLKENHLTTHRFRTIMKENPNIPIELYAERDFELERRAEESNRPIPFSLVLTFDHLLRKTNFIKDFGDILKILQHAYQTPVDVEFSVNFFKDQKYKINLLQCRPFQIKSQIKIIDSPAEIESKEIILKTSGPIIGTSIATTLDRIIYVVPSIYGQMGMRDRHEIARLIGKINHHPSSKSKKIMLLGPGRWGTSSPSLGIPVIFAEINRVSIICEIAEMHSGLIPDISLGTHFFNNIVELDMLYIALNPESKDNYLNRDYFLLEKNQLPEILPRSKQWEHAIKIIDPILINSEKEVKLNMNSITQIGFCYK